MAGAFALAEDLGLSPRVQMEGDKGGGDRIDLVANPIGLSATPPTYRTRPPRLGEHTGQVRDWLASPHNLEADDH